VGNARGKSEQVRAKLWVKGGQGRIGCGGDGRDGCNNRRVPGKSHDHSLGYCPGKWSELRKSEGAYHLMRLNSKRLEAKGSEGR